MNPSEKPNAHKAKQKNAVDRELNRLHKKTIGNAVYWKKGAVAGCFYCVKFVPADEIKDWADKGSTALCPRCRCDSIVFEQSLPFPLSISLLEALHGHFMNYDEQNKYTSINTCHQLDDHYTQQSNNLGLMPVSDVEGYMEKQEHLLGHKWADKMKSYSVNTYRSQWRKIIQMNLRSTQFQKWCWAVLAVFGLLCWLDTDALLLFLFIPLILGFKLVGMVENSMKNLDRHPLPEKYQSALPAPFSDCLYQEAEQWAKLSPSLAKVWQTWNDLPDAQLSRQDLRYFITCAREMFEGKSPYSKYQVL